MHLRNVRKIYFKAIECRKERLKVQLSLHLPTDEMKKTHIVTQIQAKKKVRIKKVC
jgi:hypothetical protein